MSNHLRSLFMLEPEVIFLNHGSFGATPRPVFEIYQEWQLRLERQPVRMLGREITTLFKEARETLANYLNTSADELVYIPNATYGVNIIAHSLKLEPGDEILTTNHEYGACDNTWQFYRNHSGACIVRQNINVPVISEDMIVDQFWRGVTPKTRVIFISHITSPTSLIFPIKKICKKARENGILTVIDGAHAPGQIQLNLTEIGADFYVGNCHKWMMAPKGSGFLYARKECQSLISPLIVSWGWSDNPLYSSGVKFVDHLEWWGTKDPSATLSVPAAIEFQNQYNWNEIRKNCHTLLINAVERIQKITGLPQMSEILADFTRQMVSIPLPEYMDVSELKERFYNDFRVEIPCFLWNNKPYMRLSVQGYNSIKDIDAFVEATAQLV